MCLHACRRHVNSLFSTNNRLYEPHCIIMFGTHGFDTIWEKMRYIIILYPPSHIHLMKILEVNRNQNTRDLLYSNVNHSPYAYTKCTKKCLKWMQIFFLSYMFWILLNMCDKLKYALSENRRRKPQGSYALHSMQTLDHDLRNGRKWSLLITCGQFKYYLHILFLKCVSYSLDKPPFHLDGWNKYEITQFGYPPFTLFCKDYQ